MGVYMYILPCGRSWTSSSRHDARGFESQTVEAIVVGGVGSLNPKTLNPKPWLKPFWLKALTCAASP